MLIQMIFSVDKDAFDSCNTQEELLDYIRTSKDVNCFSVFPHPVNEKVLKQVENLQDIYDILQDNKVWVSEKKPNSRGNIRTDLSFRCSSGMLYRMCIVHDGTALSFMECFQDISMDFEEAHYIRDVFRNKEAKGEEFSMHKLMKDAEDISHTLCNLSLQLLKATENIRPKVPVMGASNKEN